jgi:hypothetical protein
MAALLFSLACIALAFGLGGIYLGKEPGPTAVINLVAAGILAICAIAATALSIRKRQVGFARRIWGRAFLNLLIASILTAGILVAASRMNVKWDLTEPRVYTLSDFSRRVLDDLSMDMQAIYAGGPNAPEQEKLLLNQFDAASEHFQLRDVPFQELDPKLARQIADGGSQLVIFAGGQPRKVPALTERYIIQTVLLLSMRADTRLCFVTGHGEFAVGRYDAIGLSALREKIEREGFQTVDILLAAKEAVPAECDIVVIAAPEKELLPAERVKLEDFTDRGGRLLVFSEPDRPLEPGPILEKHGVLDIPATVIDEEASLSGSTLTGTEPIVNRFADFHPVVQGLNEKTGVIFSGARPLFLRGQDPNGFVYSSATSRIEMPENAKKGEDGAANLPSWMRRKTGAFPLGATIQWATDNGKEARIVVFGDIDLATNRLIGVLYNEDLVMNAVYYLANKEDAIHIRPKVEELYQSPLIPEATLSAYHSLALLIPEAILVLGLITWFRRRRL